MANKKKRPVTVPESKVTKINATKKAIVEAMKATLGNVTAACQKVGTSRDNYYKYYNEDPDFRKAVTEDVQEMAGDFVEGKLFELIDSMNPAAVMFYLKCRCKKRGYIERQEIVNTEQLSSDDIDFDAMTKEDRDKFIELNRKYQKKSE